MIAGAYYNEHDAQKAAWLRELIKAGVIAPGDVDERGIEEIHASDVMGYRQCHFFAGIGVWSYSLRLAGWPDDRGVWTASFPCPSFSCIGAARGFDDPRHYWPIFVPIFRECRPAVVFGEQSDAAIGFGWLDVVSADLETEGYAVASAVLGACSVGGADRRQRLYWMGDADGARLEGYAGDGDDGAESGWFGAVEGRYAAAAGVSLSGGIPAGAVGGFWSGAEWLRGSDGRRRPVQPGSFPLVNGAAERVLRLRGYGDAINAQVAREFIGAFMDTERSRKAQDDERLEACRRWITGVIGDDELREETGATFTDDELEEFIFIGGDPELAENHARILCDAIKDRAGE